MTEQLYKYSDNHLFVEWINSADIKTLLKTKKQVDDMYYNTDSTNIKDEHYDMLKDICEKKLGIVLDVGAPIREGENRTNLSYWMGSMDKISTRGAIDTKSVKAWKKWFKKNGDKTVTSSDKLDGVSGIFEMVDGIGKMYTRGDGKIGANISHILPYINGIPSDLVGDIVVRGELILSKNNFKKYDRTNPRNMVAGLLNGKTIREGLDDIDFLVYEIVTSVDIPIVDQYTTLRELGFFVVRNRQVTVIKEDVAMLELFQNTLTNAIEKSVYDIDGIIIHTNKPYKRNTSKNPKYAIAFKMMSIDGLHQATVTEVEWRISKHGILKPRVRITPVEMGGALVTYATGFNGNFIQTSGIGPGAEINITRSGDVIPYIVSIITTVVPQMPECEYEWNDTHIDIYPTSLEDFQKDIYLKTANTFFNKISAKFVSTATLSKLYDAGIDTIPKILNSDKKSIQQVMGKRSGERVFDNVTKALSNAPLATIVGGSNLLGHGVGIRKCKMLLKALPEIFSRETLELSEEVVTSAIMDIDGFAKKTSTLVAKNIHIVVKFLEDILYVPQEDEHIITTDSWKEEVVVFTGFRDDAVKNCIERNGGVLRTSVSKKTTIVVYKGDKDTCGIGGKPSSKIKKAENFGTKIISYKDLLKDKIFISV